MTDLLLDLVLHPTLLLSRQGYGVIFDESDFEHSPWKRSFEDLINLGALKATRGRYPSRQEMLNLMRRTDLHRFPFNPILQQTDVMICNG